MALYQDGILISGANTLPKMTLAEYNALPADQRPTYWERLDADYDDVLAEKTDIATVESGTTASRAYSVGELVYVSGTLYRVKTAIASGATFTPGTNVEVTNVSNALKDSSTPSLYLQNDYIDVYKTGKRVDVLMHPSATATSSSGTIAQLPAPIGGRSMSNNCTYALNNVFYDGFLIVGANGSLTMTNREGTTQGARTYIRGMLTYYTDEV